MYAIDITLFSSSVSNVISVLSSTMAGMSFMFIAMFFLAGLGALALCLAELLEIKGNIDLIADACLGLLPSKKNHKLNSTQRKLIESLWNYKGYTQADEIADVREGHVEKIEINDYCRLNLHFCEFSLNDYRY